MVRNIKNGFNSTIPTPHGAADFSRVVSHDFLNVCHVIRNTSQSWDFKVYIIIRFLDKTTHWRPRQDYTLKTTKTSASPPWEPAQCGSASSTPCRGRTLLGTIMLMWAPPCDVYFGFFLVLTSVIWCHHLITMKTPRCSRFCFSTF